MRGPHLPDLLLLVEDIALKIVSLSTIKCATEAGKRGPAEGNPTVGRNQRFTPAEALAIELLCPN